MGCVRFSRRSTEKTRLVATPPVWLFHGFSGRPGRLLPAFNKPQKVGHSQNTPLQSSRVCLPECLRNDWNNVMGCHFGQLRFADAHLKRQKVLFRYPVGFGEDLPPAIFGCRFRTQPGEPECRKGRVAICLNAGKQKIGF